MTDEAVPGATGQAPGTQPPVDAPEPPSAARPSVIDAAADLVQMSVDYVRQETGDVVRDKVVRPTQQAGQVVAFALAAATVLVMGILFISAAMLILLASFIGWVGALLVVGGIQLLGAGLLSYAKTRRLQ